MNMPRDCEHCNFKFEEVDSYSQYLKVKADHLEDVHHLHVDRKYDSDHNIVEIIVSSSSW